MTTLSITSEGRAVHSAERSQAVTVVNSLSYTSNGNERVCHLFSGGRSFSPPWSDELSFLLYHNHMQCLFCLFISNMQYKGQEAPAPPRAEKFFLRTPSAPPGRAIFRTFFGDVKVEVVDLVVLDRLLRAISKKKSSTFWGKKCTPDKILATPMQQAAYNVHTCQ